MPLNQPLPSGEVLRKRIESLNLKFLGCHPASPFGVLTNDRRQKSDSSFVPMEEVVVGGVRNERLLTHIAWHRATGTGGSPSLRVQTLDVRGLGQEVTADWSRVSPD
jgi:hypothetical protein